MLWFRLRLGAFKLSGEETWTEANRNIWVTLTSLVSCVLKYYGIGGLLVLIFRGKPRSGSKAKWKEITLCRKAVITILMIFLKFGKIHPHDREQFL